MAASPAAIVCGGESVAASPAAIVCSIGWSRLYKRVLNMKTPFYAEYRGERVISLTNETH